MQQTENSHLKLKATNSFHSLLMAETKYFSHDFDCSKPFLEELIHSSHQKDYTEIRRAALITLIFILRLQGVEKNISQMSSQAEN